MKAKIILSSAVYYLSIMFLLITSTAMYAQTNESEKTPLNIKNHTGLKIVAQVNSVAVMPNGISAQVLAIHNLYDQYKKLGMKSGKDFEILIVFRAEGVQFLLNDEAYNKKVKTSHSDGNPSKNIIEELQKNGVKIYGCNVAIEKKGYKIDDIFAFTRRVVTGIGAVVDFEKSGYMLITP